MISPDSNSQLSLQNIFLRGISSNTVVKFKIHKTNMTYEVKVEEIPAILKNFDFSLLLDDDLEVTKNELYFTITIPKNMYIDDYRVVFKNTIDGSIVKKENIFQRKLY